MDYNTPSLDPTDPTGTDLKLNMNGDLMLTAQGDIALVSGSDNVVQMIGTRLQTTPDTYIFGNDLGSELGTTIDEPLSPAKINLIKQYVTNALLVDPRVQQINSIDVYDPNDGSMQFFVTVNVTISGAGNITTTVPIGGGS